MAEYYLPSRVPIEVLGAPYEFYYLRRVRTYAKKPYQKMLTEEKIAKKKLNNPILWAQLDSVARGTWVNHLGAKHKRDR